MIPPAHGPFPHRCTLPGVTRADENPSRPPAPPARAAASPTRVWLAAGVLVLLAACAAGTIGTWGDPGGADAPGARANAAAVAFAAIGGGLLAGLYTLAGAGFGRLIARALRPAPTFPTPRELELLIGLAAMLTLSHLLGWLGLLTGITAWGVVLVGVVVWLASITGTLTPSTDATPRPSPLWWLLALPAVGVMLAAASSPPGWLWTSEAGGYDTLSYHLQLVREWLEGDGGGATGGGRLTPLAHNIYSYLPGYAEGAFLHLAHMGVTLRSIVGAAAGATVGELPETAILGTAWLHAFVAIGTALGLRRAITFITPAGGPRESATVAAAALAATPWVVVVGSLAYNEMFVVALGVGCVLAAVTPGLSATVRGVLIGLMGSAAVGAKPTAFFMLAPIVLAAIVTPRFVLTRADWTRLLAAAAVAGLLTGAPWLIRNFAASGNPVFPFAYSVFGDGPWSPEQHARYKSAHRFDGSVTDRFAAAVALPTAGAGNDRTHGLGGQPRGIFHSQWSILFPVGIAGLALGLVTRATHRPAAFMLMALIAQLAAWLALTHVQSRFLLPCAIPLCIGVALGIESLHVLLGAKPHSRKVALILGAACTAWLCARSVIIFAEERSGRPNAMLAYGVHALTGEPLVHEFLHMPPDMRRENFAQLPGPEVYVNAGGLDELLPTGGTLYLFGDATPFYFTHPRIPVLYHTTYDAPPWEPKRGDPHKAYANDHHHWARELWARDVRFVLVNTSELARLRRSRWYDPAVIPEFVDEFVREYTRPIASWPRRGQALYMLKPPGNPAR